jgi:hypothetical protein
LLIKQIKKKYLLRRSGREKTDIKSRNQLNLKREEKINRYYTLKKRILRISAQNSSSERDSTPLTT